MISTAIAGQRKQALEAKTYSLWDSYVFADLVTYPSLWEGWGNQFLEALRARLPVLLFEYPVYQADLKSKGFHLISLGGEIAGRDEAGLAVVNAATIEAAADQAVVYLTDQRFRTAARIPMIRVVPK